MRKCCECKAIKELEAFHTGSYWCKACRKQKDQLWYRLNKAKKKAQANARASDRRLDCRLACYEYLKDHPCVDCNEDNPIVLEFDHLPQYEKTFNITNHTGYITLEKLFAEIAKCEVVCRNCHKLRTSKRANHFRYRMYVLDHNGTGTQANGVRGSEAFEEVEGSSNT